MRNKLLSLTDHLYPQSYLLKGEFAHFMTSVDLQLEQSDFLREKYNLQKDHFYHFLMDFADAAADKKLAASLLCHTVFGYLFS